MSPYRSTFIGLMALLLAGAWLGFALLAAYFLWLLIGFVVGGVYLASLGLQVSGKLPTARWLLWVSAITVAAIVIVAVSLIPVAGGLLLFLLLVFALGAATMELWRNREGHGAAAGSRV